MATAANGTTVPAGTSVYNPQADLVTYNDSLHGRVTILAANATARLALATTCGWTPTAADPLVVLQTDTRSDWLYDGTAWQPIMAAVLHARYTASATLAVGAGAWTTATLNTTTDASTVPPGTLASNQVTVSQAGVYLLSASISCTTMAFALRISVSGVVVAQTPVGSGASLTQSVDRAIRLAAGAVVKVEIYSTGATTMSADASTVPTSLTITQLGL